MPNGLLVGALRARSCLELLVFLPAKPAYRSVFTFLGHAPRGTNRWHHLLIAEIDSPLCSCKA